MPKIANETEVKEFKEPNPNTCPICGQVLKTPSGLRGHMRWKHGLTTIEAKDELRTDDSMLRNLEKQLKQMQLNNQIQMQMLQQQQMMKALEPQVEKPQPQPVQIQQSSRIDQIKELIELKKLVDGSDLKNNIQSLKEARELLEELAPPQPTNMEDELLMKFLPMLLQQKGAPAPKNEGKPMGEEMSDEEVKQIIELIKEERPKEFEMIKKLPTTLIKRQVKAQFGLTESEAQKLIKALADFKGGKK